MEVKIKVELTASPELLAVLNAFLTPVMVANKAAVAFDKSFDSAAVIELIAEATKEEAGASPVTAPITIPKNRTRAVPQKVVAPVEEVEEKATIAEEAIEQEEQGAESHTLESIRGAAAALINKDDANRDKIKAVLENLGAPSMTKLDESKYAAFVKALKKI